MVIFCLLSVTMQDQALARQLTGAPSERATDTVGLNSSYPLTSSDGDSLLLQPNSPPLKWHSMISNLLGDWSQYYRLKFHVSNIPEFVGLGVLTAGLIVTDDATYKVSDRWYKNSRTATDVSDFFVSLGDGKSQFALAGAFAAYGLLKDDNRALRTGSQIAQAVLASGAVVQVLKHITGRESPFVRTSPTGTWRFFPNQYDKHPPSFYDFPSGHISTTMATLIVIAENYPQERWLKPVGYTLIGALGVGLVAKGMHWYSDLPMGIALGYLFGKVAANPSIPDFVKGPNEKGVDISVTPLIDGQGGGGIHLAMAS